MLDTDAITAQHFRRLHPIAIESHDEVREILERLRREKTVLRAGLNRQIDPKTAVIEEIDGDVMLLRTRDFDSDGRAYVFLEFAVDGVEHFFAARHLGARGRDRLRARVPRALYQVERRDRMRMSPLPQRGDTCRLLVKSAATGAVQGEIEDYSPAGLAIRLPARRAERLEDEFEVHFLDGARSGAAVRARVRHREPMGNRPGWTRLGLDLA
ncbi:MAG: PilZ domain-containing protein, partial [Deltaproteobacteria bacterium]